MTSAAVALVVFVAFLAVSVVAAGTERPVETPRRTRSGVALTPGEYVMPAARIRAMAPRPTEPDVEHLPPDCLTDDQLITRIDRAWQTAHDQEDDQ